MKQKQSNSYKVKLRFFKDEANGEWGVAHDNAIDNNESFNAFWNGIGIFHDIFEHYFEDVHPYFEGDYAFNIGGEVAAMGHLTYYNEQFRLEERMNTRNSFHTNETAIVSSTCSNMIEAIEYGYFDFGNKLLCNVPKQKSTHSYMLDSIICDHLYQIEQAEPNKERIVSDENNYKEAVAYKKSITENRIEKLYTWGYLQAQEIAPNTEENKETLRKFIKFWNDFCFIHKAKEVAENFKYIEFEIVKGENLSWSADFITHKGERVGHKMARYYEPIFDYEF